MLLCAGCTAYPSGEEQPGTLVRAAFARQAAVPASPQVADGMAARASVDRYQRTFEAPPPPVTVLNIGK